VLDLKIQNKKALSPIFATLIILAVVTVLFIPVFIWATGTTSQTEDSWETSGIIATERIVIEEVSLKAGAASCTIYVRNIGKTAVSVDNVFISLSDGTGVLHAYSLPTFTTSPSSVVQGDLITVTFANPNLGFIPSANETYTVKVFTTRGVGDAYQVVT
jgi:flagellin-like protein